MATFSVIIPVYNAEHTIQRCVDSILSGGDEDVQIVLVEDCSKDNSWGVCCRMAEMHKNVLCLRNERNRGVSHTRNRGLDAATGEYLLFVDSDDWVEWDFVCSFREMIEGECGFALCGYVNHDEKQNGRTDVFAWKDFEGTKTVPLKQTIEGLYHGRLLQQLWNKVFDAQIIRAHGIRFDEAISIGEDTRFVLDYIRCGGFEAITLVNRPLYHYMRDQNGSLMFRVGYESVEEPLKNLRKLYEIMGLPTHEVEVRLREDREKQIRLYAYLIMHNAGMKLGEKRRLILRLDAHLGKELYRENLVTYWKETIWRILRKS